MISPFVPLDVHTSGVVVVNVTVRLELAVALTVTGDCAIVLLARLPNVIVWFNFALLWTAKLCVADGAALYVASPAWSALTVQVPGPPKLTSLAPLTVQTCGVVVVNVTVRPEVAVAVGK